MAELKAKIYSEEGKLVGEEKLDSAIFGITPNNALIHQAVVAQEANSRSAIANTKDRGEVSGGGKKPWKQKGTGRARHGSSRSPIWVGGGVTFGPMSNRNFSLKINKKMKRKALLMCLSDKAKDAKILVLDAFGMEVYKTSKVAKMLKNLPVLGSVLFVLAASDAKINKSSENIPALQTTSAGSLNVIDVLKAGTFIVTKDGLRAMEKFLAPKVK